MSDREKTVQGQLNAAVEDQTLRGWRLIGEAAETIERLTRERDEAEQRGYRKGVEDAAKAVMFLGYAPPEIEEAILALKDK